MTTFRFNKLIVAGFRILVRKKPFTRGKRTFEPRASKDHFPAPLWDKSLTNKNARAGYASIQERIFKVMAKIFKHKTDVAYFDYKDFKTLQRYVNVYGQIETRKKTGLTESQQRRLATAIKRARHIALLPFVANN